MLPWVLDLGGPSVPGRGPFRLRFVTCHFWAQVTSRTSYFWYICVLMGCILERGGPQPFRVMCGSPVAHSRAGQQLTLLRSHSVWTLPIGRVHWRVLEDGFSLGHLAAGAKKVLQCPSLDEVHGCDGRQPGILIVPHRGFYASCTTNGLALAVMVLQNAFCIEGSHDRVPHLTEALPRDGTSRTTGVADVLVLHFISSSIGAAKAVGSSSPRSEYDFWHDFAGINIDVSVVDGTVGSEKPPLRYSVLDDAPS